jgi:hypothetical protein
MKSTYHTANLRFQQLLPAAAFSQSTSYSCFSTVGEKENRFDKEQEICGMDVERTFGMLQYRWTIVRHTVKTWSKKTLWEVITACVIMLNMIF